MADLPIDEANIPAVSFNELGAAATTPTTAGYWKFYFKSDGAYYVDDTGAETGPLADGSGSVSSVGLTMPAVFTVADTPVTTAGTMGVTFATGQTANYVLASPDGTSGALSVRALVADDIPALPATKITPVFSDTAFAVQDDGDPSKALTFQLSGYTTTTTHAMSWPDTDGEVTVNNATQSLTNKTLTTPTIGDLTNAQHDHEDAAGGGQLALSSAVFGTGGISALATSGTVNTANDKLLIESGTDGDYYWVSPTNLGISGGGGGSTTKFIWDSTDIASGSKAPYKGGNTGTARHAAISVPHDFVTLVKLSVFFIAFATETIQFDFTTSYAAAGTDKDTHTGSLLNQSVSATDDFIYEFDITSTVASLAADDILGVETSKDSGDNSTQYLGVLLEYTT